MKAFARFRGVVRDVLCWEGTYVVILSLVCLWSLHHYFFDVRPWFERLSFGYPPTSVVLPADPHIYWRFSNFTDLDDLAINVFGPTILLKIFQTNTDLAFLFNVVSVFFAVSFFAKGLGRSGYFTGMVLFANPLIISQIFYPNKELYMLISSLLFLAYLKLGLRRLLVVGLAFLFFTKIEFILLSLAWLFSRRFSMRFRLIAIAYLVIFLSIFYNSIPGISGKLTVLSASLKFGELGLTGKLQYLASEYNLFFAIVVPKVLNAMLIGVIDFIRYPEAFAAGFTTVISSFLMTFMAIAVTLKLRLKSLSDEHIFLLLWFVAVATVPFSLHRYLFPIYPFLYSLLLKESS